MTIIKGRDLKLNCCLAAAPFFIYRAAKEIFEEIAKMKIINNNPGSIFDVKLHSDKNNICIYDVYFKSDVPCVPSKITVEFNMPVLVGDIIDPVIEVFLK